MSQNKYKPHVSIIQIDWFIDWVAAGFIQSFTHALNTYHVPGAEGKSFLIKWDTSPLGVHCGEGKADVPKRYSSMTRWQLSLHCEGTVRMRGLMGTFLGVRMLPEDRSTEQSAQPKLSIDMRLLSPLNSFWELRGKITSYIQGSKVWAQWLLLTLRCEGENQVSDSWPVSTLPIFNDHFFPQNLSSQMCHPPSKNTAASEILCISDAICSKRKSFSIHEWPSAMDTGHFHSSRFHQGTVT